ncbi:MAG: YidC/Oxa1 family membrane protein insertase [Oscillospiraceae bacterium]|nr:YidC/Oxa1 family membrane protein insertase [Oscillospiraceae bacterium]
MILAFSLWDIIRVPFGWLLSVLYDFTSNYGIALIIFAVALKLIMFPITAKSKKSTMKMSRLTPRIQALQKKYANDQQKLNEETQKLYQQEGVSMGGGCLWSFIPLLILIPLYTVVREPIVYMLGETAEVAAQIVETIKAGAESAFSNNAYYDQLIAAPLIPQFAEELKNIVANPDTLQGMEFNFLNINLGAVPQWKIWTWDTFDWAHIGAFIVPLLSAGSQVLSMLVSQKMNNSVITNEKGVQDEEAAKNSQTNQSNKMMMYMMPLMSLWIGFTVPGALSLYWFVQGIVSLVMDVFLTKHYRKIYDAEDAVRLARALEEEQAEAERERLRAERRAANPDGITQNTSKKKLQQKQQREADAAKAAAAKEYAAKKGIVEEEHEEPAAMSGIPDRPYAKGRNYDPNRYGHNTEE